MHTRSRILLSLAGLVLFAGCIAGIGTPEDDADGPQCHGVPVADEPVQEPSETVPVSNATIQSTDPIATVIEYYRTNGTHQRIGVDGVRADETRRALVGLDRGHGNWSAHVRLDDGRTVLVALSANGTLCAGPQ